MVEHATCLRCGEEDETALHRWWKCPALAVARRQAQVDDLAREGLARDFQPRCLWQNGIVPSAAVAVEASGPMKGVEEPAGGPLPGLGGAVVEAWTDGAAIEPGIPQLRRAGWGLWIPGPLGCAMAEAVKGPAQTAQRAEVRAFVAAVEYTGGAVKVWTDSRFVCSGVRYLDLGLVPPFAHRDLWERALRAWRPGVSSAAWVKAHLEWDEAESRGIPRHAWEGNRRADALAGNGAALHEVEPAVAARIRGVVAATERAQLWMVEALQISADRDPARPKVRRQGRRAPVRVARPRPRGGAGDHGPITEEDGFWWCGTCDRRVRNTRPWGTWRRMPCNPPVVAPPQPAGGQANRAVGRGRAARTQHELRVIGDRTQCVLCGRSCCTADCERAGRGEGSHGFLCWSTCTDAMACLCCSCSPCCSIC